jgi:tetratricopeptide (TPR) repeat protein
VGYGAYTAMNWYNAKTVKQAGDDYSAFMAAAAKAEAIADPLQRCLSYPDIPGTHWNQETTRAYCELRNHKTIQLSEIEALLKQGKADEVDRVFQGYLDTQRRDPKQPGLLDIAFANAGFDDSNDNARRVIDMWKRQSPTSAFALAASGVQYVYAAQQARGTGWSRDLNDQQIDGMNQQLGLAFEDLDHAVSLNASITAIFPSMIHAGGLNGDDAYMYQAVGMGLKADPSNFAIRMQMMNHAQSKWGGNFGGVDAQSAEDLSLASKNSLLRMVAQRPAVYRAICDCYGTQVRADRLVLQAVDQNVSAGDMVDLAGEVYDANRRLAVELYSEVIRFAAADNVDALRWRSQEMMALGDKAGATTTFAAVASRYPDNQAMATQLGNIYAQAGDAKHAEAVLLAVLQREPNNYDAMGTLGDLYNHAGHQPQKAEALADALISQYPDKPGGYIVRACNQMDHNLPGVYDTIHHFIDRFGDDPDWKSQTAEMRAYLVKHPENIGT